MRGPKLNEGATAIGERHGTKAVAKHVRTSAYKAREVLNLIRGLDVRTADNTLQLVDRAVAHDVRKVLASAVSNAANPDSGSYIADVEELFVLACFADEGATMRRFRPRARGNATRIRKRTCHITVVVARMTDDRIEIIEAREERRGTNAAANRKARVQRSRQRAEAAKDAATDEVAADATEADSDDTSADAADEAPAAEVQGFADVAEATDDAPAAEADDARAAATGEFAAGEWAGSVLPDVDGNGPDTHLIKGNADSMLYHNTDSRYYKVTKAEVWFDTEENAEAAGFSKPGSQKDED